MKVKGIKFWVQGLGFRIRVLGLRDESLGKGLYPKSSRGS